MGCSFSIITTQGPNKNRIQSIVRKRREKGHCRQTMKRPRTDREVQGKNCRWYHLLWQKMRKIQIQTYQSLKNSHEPRRARHVLLVSLDNLDINPIFYLFLSLLYRSGHGLKKQGGTYHPKSKMFLNGFELCSFCLVQHSVAQSCASLCEHCKSLHMLTDLVDGQCPKLKGFAQVEECNSMMPCGKCSLGKRVADLEAGKQVSFGKDTEENQQEKQKLQGTECQECLGIGMLPLLTFCCKDGCHKCGFLKLRPHPGVKRLHMRPILSEKERKQCAICLQVIKQGDSVFRMQCDHEFHFLCMGQWLLTSKRCPYCRHTDMFLEIDAHFIELLRQLQGHPKPDVIPAYINEYGEVVEGIESDEAYSQEDEEEDEHIDIHGDDEADAEEQPIGSFPVDVIQNHEEGEVILGSEAMLLLSGIGINFPVSHNFLSQHSGYSSSSEECCFERGDDDYDGLWGV